MEKRICLESRGKQPQQVLELNLDNCRTVGEFEGLTNEFSNLTKLSVIKAGLTSFKGFPSKLKALEKLDVSENRISSGLHHIQDCLSITHLCLTSNKFKDLSSLAPLSHLQSLTHLDLGNTPVSEQEEYRTKVFDLLPNLKFLDGQDKEGNEASSSEDEDEKGDSTTNGVSSKDEQNEDLEEEEEEVSDEESGEEESGEEDEGPGLAALYTNSNLEDSDDSDFTEEGAEREEDDDHLDEESDEELENTRGKKRKHEEEENV